MKVLTIYICLVVLSYGCSKDSPTSPTFTEQTLDTTTKEESGYAETFTIQRWDGENWIDTDDKLVISSVSWKFISLLDRDDGGVRIKGGYTLNLYNPSDNDVEFLFSKLIFYDESDVLNFILIITGIRKEVNVVGSVLVKAKGTATYSASFEIEFYNIDAANQIAEMEIWGRATIPIE